ncbi:MAG: alanine--glyoxylate aminotransferase family protein [Candidatus Scalindua sp. AMX11]|nr:MAG: alanine--glyoxylate aminotransferase family protein [Candidatus Scalindua sp.]NOG82471.1 alanine--glyoxylate aminotransferase family protein [Planctomycetota bacterium]RZV93905.1 MAG: alanine--glyoxylate aminotransferase family protein [Candidatus Scalindua sp. SCAELEC01]TDE65526.1 MAG: alanine--glyoxylate aminotransferase family protein [Candidatus Scalindua sp. AMX11]GJQ58107.1 MAG: serine-pyruvate aminotransferase [Candidatus Scalindua sp.]
MKKTYLFTPGPTQIPPDVVLAEASPMIHHRTSEFSDIFANVSEDLKYIFQTNDGEVFTFASSGTGGMEACVVNSLSRGDKAVVVRGGKFGERWAQLCETFGVTVVSVDVENGKAVDPDVLNDTIQREKEVKAVFATLSETSTGVVHNIEAIAKVVKGHNLLLVVDAISGIGVHPLMMDAWGIDIAVTGSQKGCMLPPGLAFVCVAKSAWGAIEKSDLPKYYWNFKKMQKALSNRTTAYTPAISLIMAAGKALAMIREEGIENVWSRHAKLANATREGVKALGLELFAGDASGNVLTSVKAPEGVNIDAGIKKLRDETGVTITGGQDELKGKIFRIGHMGYVNEFDIVLAISAVEKILYENGYKMELGKGVSRVQEILVG